jgi:hypothetical protein
LQAFVAAFRGLEDASFLDHLMYATE